jgi:hypothetical protein
MKNVHPSVFPKGIISEIAPVATKHALLTYDDGHHAIVIAHLTMMIIT